MFLWKNVPQDSKKNRFRTSEQGLLSLDFEDQEEDFWLIENANSY